jgi:ABC-type thiamin/hydroxymethylpyrimidine transport system permease subunit
LKLDNQPLVGLIVVCAFVGVVYLWFFHPPGVSAELMTALNLLTGTLGAMASMVVSYYFGSSKGSASKDDALNAIATTATTATAGATPTAPSNGKEPSPPSNVTGLNPKAGG